MAATDAELQEMLQYYRVQKLLNTEASLLDNWRLSEWLDLYTDDARYYVPPTDIDPDRADPAKHLYYISDDRARMQERVIRLEKKTCHSEHPRSKVRHIVSNIEIHDDTDDSLSVTASFVVYRSKNGSTDMFIGEYRYHLIKQGDGLKIKMKSCALALDGLRPQAKISIIL